MFDDESAMRTSIWLVTGLLAASCVLGAEVTPEHSPPTLRKLDAGKREAGPTDLRAITPGQESNATDVPRVALIIGNSRYDRINQLPNAVQDARDMCESLRGLKFIVTCAYDLPTPRALRDTVRTFAQTLSQGQAAVFYFAGHGVQLGNENYMLPTNIDPRSAADIEDGAVRLTYVLRLLEERRSGPNVVIVDACREDPFAGQFRDVRRGLAAAEPPPNTMLVYATAANDTAMDNAGKNGLFMKHLLLHLEEPGIKIDDLFRIVALGVQQEAAQQKPPHRQLPYRMSQISQAVCFAGCDQLSTEDRAKMKDLVDKLNDLNARYQASQTASQAKSEQLEAVKAQVQARDRQIADLKSRNIERDASIVSLEGRIKEVTQASAPGVDTNGEAARELSRLLRELAEVKEAQRKDAIRIEQQNAERSRAVEQLDKQRFEYEKVARQLDDERRKVQDLQKSLTKSAPRASAPPIPSY